LLAAAEKKLIIAWKNWSARNSYWNICDTHRPIGEL